MPFRFPPLTKEQKKNLVVGVTTACSFCFVYWSYGLKPVQQKIVRQEAEVKRLESEVSNAQRQAKRLPEIQREYETLKALMVNADKQLPKEKDLSGLLRLMTHELLRFRLRLASLSPETVRDQNFYQSFPLQITLSGHFHSLGRFLTALGTKERILSVENLKMSLASASDTDATIQASFTLMAYMSKG